MFGIPTTLKIGAAVFVVSAALLLVLPGVFLNLLLLDGESAPLQWSMRMLGLTLVALSVNMWLVSNTGNNANLAKAGLTMAVVASGLGVLTLLIPAKLGWFSVVYAVVGFAFGLNYAVCLIRLRKP